MNDLIKFLKTKGFGDLLLVVIGVGTLTMSYYKYLQIKAIRQQIEINEDTLKEKDNGQA